MATLESLVRRQDRSVPHTIKVFVMLFSTMAGLFFFATGIAAMSVPARMSG